MESNEIDKILIRAIVQNGAERQIEMVPEEFGELLQKLNKIQRSGMLSEISIIRPGEHDLDYKKCLLFFDLCSEIADCKLLLRQLEHLVGEVGREAVEISTERKVLRLQERLNKNTQ